MNEFRFPIACAAILLGGLSVAQDAPQWRPPVALQKAMAKATVHNKRVLAVFAQPGEDLAGALQKDRALSRKLLYEFETVALAGADAASAAKQWQLDDPRPALVVLAADGAVREKLSPADILAEGKLAGAALLKRLEPQFCPPVDAEQKLAAGLAAGKKSGRNVFVRFDAPW